MSKFAIYNYNFLRIIEPNPEYQIEFPGWVNVNVKESFDNRQQLLEEVLLADFGKPFQFEKRVCHKSMAHPLLCYLLYNPRSIVAYSKKGII